MSRPPQPPNAFTLLEVILSLGILAAALAVIGEVTSRAYTNASRASGEGEAVLIAESVMAQVLAGLLPAAATPATDWTPDEEVDRPAAWRYSIEVAPTDLQELLLVSVMVEEVAPGNEAPLTGSLSRWVLNPAEVGL